MSEHTDTELLVLRARGTAVAAGRTGRADDVEWWDHWIYGCEGARVDMTPGPRQTIGRHEHALFRCGRCGYEVWARAFGVR